MPPGVTVRDATEDDLETVVALETQCLGEDAWSRSLVEAGLRGEVPTVHYLVAEVAGHVVGYAALSVVDVAELQRIAVAPLSRRGGVASGLLESAVELADSSGSERLLLEVREDNVAARALYEARGFEELARRRRYYRDGATAVVMARPLGP